MKSQGWNQKDLAELAETTQASISRTLSGSVPSSEIIYNLKKNAKVDPLWLLTGEGEMFLSERVVREESVTVREKQILSLLRETPEMEVIVLAFLKGSANLKELVAVAEKLPEEKRVMAVRLVEALGG